MLQNAMICHWCKADLRGMAIPEKTQIYFENSPYLSKATMLLNHGYEHEECGCRWTYEGKIFRDGMEEFKDKYKIEEIPTETKDESVVTENTTTENNSGNNILINESEGKSNENESGK